MGTDEVDIAANVRVYGDGKFRNTETASGTTADLSVIPQNSQTTKWLDITKADDEETIIWETDRKKWKESSTTLGETDTLHTVGNGQAGRQYAVKVDGVTGQNISGNNCASGICLADQNGKITFLYTGGYSDHTFEITEEEVQEEQQDASQELSGQIEDAEEDSNKRDLNIHKVKATSTENSITISWKTDHNTKTSLRYGTDKNLKEKIKDSDKKKKHEITIGNLLPGTEYYFRIKAKDSHGNEDRSRIHSIATQAVLEPQPVSIEKTRENTADTSEDSKTNAFESDRSQEQKQAAPQIDSNDEGTDKEVWNESQFQEQTENVPQARQAREVKWWNPFSWFSKFSWWNPFSWF